MLHRINYVPEGLLDCTVDQVVNFIPESTLITLGGAREDALFLSILLHGNEPTGLVALQNILKKYRDTELPRALLIFIGNVKAAHEGKRRLDGQPDYNRIWLEGHSDHETEIHQKITDLLHDMARRPLFASIDIHNNTGLNPHYACVNRLKSPFLNLARRFSRTVIYFIQPGGVQSKAFSHLCPSVTLECGKVGDEFGIQRATAFVDEVLNLDAIESDPVSDNDIDMFHTLAVIKIPEHISLSFDESDTDIRFIQGIETLNFEEIPAGTILAHIREGVDDPILVMDEEGNVITQQVFEIRDNNLITLRPLMPSMLTLDERVIRQDCLCYAMERYSITMGEKITRDDAPVWLPAE